MAGSQTIDKAVRAVLAHDTDSHFNFGIFTDAGFELQGNIYTDSYNSLIGPYEPSHPGMYGDVGTNARNKSNAVLLNNTVIYGNAFTGYRSDPNLVILLKNRARIYGIKTTLDRPKMLPPHVPSSLPKRGSFHVASGSSEVVIKESGEYSSFYMESNTTVTISGKVTLYINGDFTMRSNSVLNLARGSEVEIVLGKGDFKQESNTYVNNLTRSPKNLVILGTARFRNMVWRADSDFYGSIYVPKANVNFKTNSNFYGSIVCYYLTLSSPAGFHYDESLSTWRKYGARSPYFVVKTLEQTS